jgi:toxin CptA
MTLKEALSYVCSTAKTISCGNGAWAANSPKIRSCRPLSSESSNTLIDWRPSLLLSGALACLGGLAAMSLWMSALPLAGKLPLAAMALAFGLAQARREACRPGFSVRITSDETGLVAIRAQGRQPLGSASIGVRGPLAWVAGRGDDGRLQRILWWPDTLPAGARRALRLVSGNRIAETGPALATMSG